MVPLLFTWEISQTPVPVRKDIPYPFLTGTNATSVDALVANEYGTNQNMVTNQGGISGHLYPGSPMKYKLWFFADRENVNPIDWTSNDAK